MTTVALVLDPTYAEQLYTVELDGQEYRLRLRWQEASYGWYADLFDLEGRILQAGRRLSPGWSPFLGLSGPPGGWLVSGVDDAGRAALNTEALRLLYIQA